MSILFVNAAFREGSRTLRLAEEYLMKQGDVVLLSLHLGNTDIKPLNTESLKKYNSSVATSDFEDPMFDWAKQFCEADEIVIAAPFWNFSVPAILHVYLELVCSQGVSFDITADGVYYSLCKAKKLTYITTAGGIIPEEDHAFGYLKTLSDVFWKIPEINYYKADGLDLYGVDVEKKLRETIEQFR